MEAAKSAVERFILDPANHDVLALLKALRNGAVYGTKVRFPHALVMVFLFKSGPLREKLLAVFQATRQHARNLATFAVTWKVIMLLLRSLPASSSPNRPHKPFTPSPTFPHPSSLFSIFDPASGPLPRRKEHGADSFVAGLAAGYLVFGRRAAASSSVNQQIVIYVFARVCLALAKLAVAPRGPRPSAYAAGYGEVRRGGGGALDVLLGLLGVTGDRAEGLKDVVARNSWAVFASVSWGLVMWLFRWHPEELQPSLRSSMRYLYDNAERWDGLRNFLWHNQ